MEAQKSNHEEIKDKITSLMFVYMEITDLAVFYLSDPTMMCPRNRENGYFKKCFDVIYIKTS